MHGTLQLETPGTAKEHNKRRKVTVNPNNRQTATLTEQAPDTISKEVLCIAPGRHICN